LLGGRSAEREISLKSGGGVLNALLTKGVDAHAFDPGLRSIHELASAQFDRVFIALHGRFGEDGTIQGLYQNGSGNVGIGTTSPAYKFDVLGATGNSVIASFRSGETTTSERAGCGFQTIGNATATSRASRMWLDADGGDFGGSDYFYISKAGNSGIVQLIQQSNAAMTFETNGVEKMRIDASGNLLVGASADGQPDANYFMARNASGFQANIGHATGTASGQPYVYMVYAGGAIGSITQSGTTAVLYNVTSDQRLKTNIVDATSGNIDDIKVRSFDWIADGSHQEYGMVAQELVTVAPYAVHQPTNPNEMMGVDYSKLVPMMIKEIQDLKQRIATLENK
jgi:hypothetical protein